MEDDLLNWWKKLSHNERKIFLTNYDFVNSKIKIETYSDLYSLYKIVFGIGIRQRLDNFCVNIENIKEIISLKKLIINHISFINLSILEKFENLEELYYQNYKIENIISLKNLKLKTLSIQCNNLDNLDFIRSSKIENLNLIYCYKLTSLEALKECVNLKKLQLIHLGFKLKADSLSHIDEILLNKNQIYPNEIEYSFYRDKFMLMNNFINNRILNRKHLYTFDNEETSFILKNGNEYQKVNYTELIMSKIYSVHINSFTEWTLKKNYS